MLNASSRYIIEEVLEPDGESESNEKKKLDEFSLFHRLPTEIQANIWKMSLEDDPRVVQLGSFMNEPNKIRQINRQIASDCLTLHGFYDLDQLKQKENPSNNTLFHPQIDLIHLGPNSTWLWGSRSSVRRFAACGALDKIRCVAIMKPKTQLAADVQFSALREYKSLELVFIVVKVSVRTSILGWKAKEWVQFVTVDDQEAGGLIRDQWFSRRLCKHVSQEYRDSVQEMMARGDERISPRVVFVEELRAWGEAAQGFSLTMF